MKAHYTWDKMGGRGLQIIGPNLTAGLEKYAPKMIENLGLGTAAGYKIIGIGVQVDEAARYHPIRVTVTVQGLPVVAGTMTAPKSGTIYITGPTPSGEEIKTLTWQKDAIDESSPAEYYDFCHPKHPRYVGPDRADGVIAEAQEFLGSVRSCEKKLTEKES